MNKKSFHSQEMALEVMHAIENEMVCFIIPFPLHYDPSIIVYKTLTGQKC